MKITIQSFGIFCFIPFFLSTCPKEDEKEETITVEIEISGTVRTRNSQTGKEFGCPEALYNKTIRIEFGKAGYLGKTHYLSIDEYGNFSSKGESIGWVDLYKEQPAEAKAFIDDDFNIPEEYTQFRGYDKLLWDDVYPSVDFGGSYKWHAFLNIVLVFDP